MEKLVVIRGFSRPQELKELLGPRFFNPSEAESLMLSKLRKDNTRADNSDDYFVGVCVASEECVVRRLDALGQKTNTTIRVIKVHE
ncbi:MAG: hypothetical protein GYA55_10645 [SAR324 cluster bacterium]|uniref:Uncharacterized protein n=1 Tax=SAR324 cluster bacterium TaxID=2024889 RepID=A0A7X9FTP3_9DELT|nr:hypothetical protein [SAR324 cluster bacterium]